MPPDINKISSIKDVPKNAPIAVYLRKSRLEDGKNEEDTLKRHREEMDRFIRRYAFTNVTYYEEVKSGENIASRPKMIELLDEIRSGTYMLVVAIHIDRLSRGEAIDRGIMIKTFKDSGTLLYTLSSRKLYDYANDSAGEKLLSEIELLFSSYEYATIKRRMDDGKRRAFENGKIIGSKPPYGYVKNFNTNTYEIEEEKAEVVRFIYDRYLSGFSSHKIAKELNANRILTPSGNPSARWSHTTVMQVIKNPFYCGKVAMNKAHYAKKKDGKISTRRKNPEDYEIRQGTHTPIISEATYNKALAMIKDNVKRPPVTRANKFKLTGLVRCLACGHMLTVRKKIRADGSTAHLIRRCKYPLPDGINDCRANRGISEDVLLDVLRKDMQRFKDELFAHNDDLSKDTPSLSVNPIDVQQSIIDEATGKIERATALFIDGLIDRERLDRIIAKESATIDEANTEIARLSESPESKKDRRRKVWSSVEIESLFHEETSPEDFNRVIRLLVESIAYLRDSNGDLKVEITYK